MKTYTNNRVCFYCGKEIATFTPLTQWQYKQNTSAGRVYFCSEKCLKTYRKIKHIRDYNRRTK